MEKSRGKSRRARQLRKQLELISVCKNANNTSMKTYLAVLVALVDSLYVLPRWFFWWVIIGTKITRVMDQDSFESESRSGFSLLSQTGSSFNQVNQVYY
jgi:hypothetical protein